jgi:DNA-directed RNA polymerase specialized sigma24 family protein
MTLLRKKTDHELIHQFRDGDLYALEALIVRHKDKLYTSILFLVKDKYLAEDIFQDVLIKIIDTIRGGRYTEEGKFLPWAMRIAHNLCVDHFRKVKRTPAIKTSDDRDIFEEVIILRHYADLSFKEIAALTNCSINTALGRMRYGLINLRKMMTEKKIAL